MAEIDLDEVRDALVGNTRAIVTPAFIVALTSVASWPVDAFTVDVDDQNVVNAVYWLRGSSIGTFRFSGERVFNGLVRHVSAVSALSYTGTVDVDAFRTATIRRWLVIRFQAEGDEISVIESPESNHFATLQGNFIDAVLNAVGKLPGE